ncbi:hypothetical protein AB0O76_14455 [Streptomyces sp. NPDC086554]
MSAPGHPEFVEFLPQSEQSAPVESGADAGAFGLGEAASKT